MSSQNDLFVIYNSNKAKLDEDTIVNPGTIDNELLAIPKITQTKQHTQTSYKSKVNKITGNKNITRTNQLSKIQKPNIQNSNNYNDILYNSNKASSYNDWFNSQTTSKHNLTLSNMKTNTDNIETETNEKTENIYINAWIRLINNKLIHRNFGDDINYSFLDNIINYNIKLYNSKAQKCNNYLLIGSILIDKYIDEYSIVWGSGMLKPKQLTGKPYKVCAVRGPKTRQILLDSGIECPEIYGDPALLMPYNYYPYVSKKYKIGIIPHHSHINTKLLFKLRLNKNIKIINFVKYESWKHVIKDMLSCDFIVSESLHGLIISDAYKIPNYYISFGNINQDFKYEDYFLSVGKKPYKPYIITNTTKYEDLMALKQKCDNTFNINLNKLVNASPIKLNNLTMTNKIKPYTGKVLLCCIGKMENLYIKEFVDYYKSLGFDNICLYDNNDKDGEHFEDVIKDDIDSGFVILKDVRGMKEAQMPCYTKCYNEYRTKYDWIAFFDIDEFLHIDGNKSIKQFLSNDMYNDRGINCIRVCWKQFDDSDIIKTNGDYSVKKFKTYLPITNIHATQTKPIIKTILPETVFTSAHGPVKDKNVKCVNTAGNLCSNTILIKNVTWDNACLHHYRFKTIEEFVLQKMIRLWPTHYKNGGKTGLNLNMFFTFNKKTKEKEDYAEMLIKKHNISRNT